MKRTSIRFRLITRLTLALLAAAVVTNAALYVYLRGELIEQYDAALNAQARSVTEVWQGVAESEDAATAITRAFPNMRFGRSNGNYLRVVRSDGSTVLQVPSAKHGELWRDSKRKPTTRRISYDLTLPNGQAGRAIEIGVNSPTADGSAPMKPPRFALVLAENRHEMTGTLTNFGIWLFAIGGGLSALSIWLVLTIVNRELRPIGEFSEAVSRLDADSLTYRFPTDQLADELIPVATRLNELLHRLDDAFGRERRFTGNVAHELRTPLAELRSMVEVTMRWPPKPAELHRHHEQVLDVVRRMSTVTQTLLTLVRSGEGRLAATAKDVDLVRLLKIIALPHEGVAAERGVEIDFVMPKSLTVWADDALLGSLFDNLFGNAARYATAGSRIECYVADAADGRGAVVRLTNAASDLTEEDLPHLEEPFWRKDSARSADDHAGLGLTLVRAYATAMQAGVRFSMPDAGRLTVEVVVPQRPAVSE